jgi:hypothetical protein
VTRSGCKEKEEEKRDSTRGNNNTGHNKRAERVVKIREEWRSSGRGTQARKSKDRFPPTFSLIFATTHPFNSKRTMSDDSKKKQERLNERRKRLTAATRSDNSGWLSVLSCWVFRFSLSS